MWTRCCYRSIPGGYVRQQGGPWLLNVSIPWFCRWRAREKEQKRKNHNWIILPRNVNFNADKTLLLWLLASDAPTSPLQKFALFTIHFELISIESKVCLYLLFSLLSIYILSKTSIIGGLMAPPSVFECLLVILTITMIGECGVVQTRPWVHIRILKNKWRIMTWTPSICLTLLATPVGTGSRQICGPISWLRFFEKKYR